MAGTTAPAAQGRREYQYDEGGAGSWVVWFIFVLILVIAGLMTDEQYYHVAIDAVAGLDPKTDLKRPTLDPEFSLRVRIDPGLWKKHDACLDVGSAVAVSYGRYPLAAAAVPSKLCAGGGAGQSSSGWDDASVAVVAKGNGVRLPRPVRDTLAWELWAWGSPEFDVTLTVPYEGRWNLVSCKARVGISPLLQAPCNVTVLAAPRATAEIRNVALPEKDGVVRADSA